VNEETQEEEEEEEEEEESPGTLTRASSEPAPWRDLGGLEIHVILPQPWGAVC